MRRLIVYCQSVHCILIYLDYWKLETWGEMNPLRRASRFMQ